MSYLCWLIDISSIDVCGQICFWDPSVHIITRETCGMLYNGELNWIKVIPFIHRLVVTYDAISPATAQFDILRPAQNGQSLFVRVPVKSGMVFNTLRPRRNGRCFPHAIFKYVFLNENVWISIKISLKFVRTRSINNILVLVQIMAWHRPGDKPLSETIMVDLLTHICVARPHWVNIHTFLQRRNNVSPKLTSR